MDSSLSTAYSDMINQLAKAMQDAAEVRHALAALDWETELARAQCILDPMIYAGTNDIIRKANLTIHLANDPLFAGLENRVAARKMDLADADMRTVVATQQCRLLRLLMADALTHSDSLEMADADTYNPEQSEHGQHTY